jgi:hypothetical protein
MQLESQFMNIQQNQPTRTNLTTQGQGTNCIYKPPKKTVQLLPNEIDTTKEQETELERYNYYKLKNEGQYGLAKNICQYSYSNFNTNYLGDEMDSILINGKMIDECNDTDKQGYIRSYQHLYQNLKKVIIELEITDFKDQEEFTGAEARHILENMKIPDYTKLQKTSYTDYFKSFIFSNVIPQSHQTTAGKDFKISNVWIHTSDAVINFYTTKSGQCEYKFILI